MLTFSFKCTLIPVGGDDLGRAMAEALIAMDRSVIMVVEKESKLSEQALG